MEICEIDKSYPSEGSVCKVISTLTEANSSDITIEHFSILTNFPLDTECTIVIGDSENSLQESIESMLRKMKVGQKCSFNIANDNGKLSQSDSYKVIPVQDGIFNLQLNSFEETKNVNQLSCLEMLERAKHYKQLGNKLFNCKNIQYSFKKYCRALKFLIMISDSVKDEQPHVETEYKTLKVQLHLNMSACQLQFEGFGFAVENCTKALDLEPGSVKALYRRGLAYKSLKEYEKSLEDFEKAMEIDGSNKSVKKELLEVKSQLQFQNANVAQAMSKMFST